MDKYVYIYILELQMWDESSMCDDSSPRSSVASRHLCDDSSTIVAVTSRQLCDDSSQNENIFKSQISIKMCINKIKN